jgi:hypothetical protein
MRLLWILYLLLTTTLFGQESPKSKTTRDIIGTWEFRPFHRKFDHGEKVLQPIWVIMKMSFSAQGHFKFVLHDSVIQEGKWDISEDGKKLLLSERSQTPEYHEELQPLSFNITTKTGRYIKLLTKEEGKDIEIEFKPVK